ncbi:hypothetical protein [Spirillospora sp. CA-294931]|uniref:hypothetical protein n=1 Tax=Spirillospora sp. CA-294931 TaxID=3240042 RepID=UPI003D8BEAB3
MLADLHLHFHGCVPPRALLDHLARGETVLWDWYESGMEAAYGTVPPTREVVARHRAGDATAAAAFEELFVFGDADAGTFDRFQAKANLLWAASPSPLPEYAAAIRAAHRAQGVGHAEYRIAADMFAPLHQGGLERFAVTLDRSDPWREWARVREIALGPHGHALTGIDFCGVEEGHPPKELAAFLAAVHDFNAAHPDRALALLVHVGESFGDKSLESAVRWVQDAAELGAHRLGHAIALGVDPARFGPHTRAEPVTERRDQIAYDLRHRDGLRARGVPVDPASLREERARLARLPDTASVTVGYDAARLDEIRRRQRFAIDRIKATGAVIEVCPTSNRRIGGIDDPAHHPVHRFLAEDVPFVVASDDPGIFGVTLRDELDWVVRQTGGGADLRRHLIEAAAAARSENLTGRV